jgi:5-methylcytosine-specific restriction enzyme A
MALRAWKTCQQSGCPALIREGSRCEKHASKEERKRYEEKRSDPVWMMYQTPEWKKFRAWYLRLNPRCQRIVDGKCCEHIADTVHHRISPRQQPDLFRDADNVKAVCRAHHPPTEGDTGKEVWADSETRLSLEKKD